MNENWIRIDSTRTKTTFFVNKNNINGIAISPEKPTEFSIICCGDEEASFFCFGSVEERNQKLNEILGVKPITEPTENNN